MYGAVAPGHKSTVVYLDDESGESRLMIGTRMKNAQTIAKTIGKMSPVPQPDGNIGVPMPMPDVA